MGKLLKPLWDSVSSFVKGENIYLKAAVKVRSLAGELKSHIPQVMAIKKMLTQKNKWTWVYLWLILDVWQKITQSCKAIILQLKKNKVKKSLLSQVILKNSFRIPENNLLTAKEVLFNNSSMAQFHCPLLYLHYSLCMKVCTYLIKGEPPGCRVSHHYMENTVCMFKNKPWYSFLFFLVPVG